MTMRALQWAIDIEGLYPIEKLVLIGLAERAGHDFDSGRTIAKASDEELSCFAGCSVDTVSDTLDKLYRVGVIGGAVDHEYPLYVGKQPREVRR